MLGRNDGRRHRKDIGKTSSPRSPENHSEPQPSQSSCGSFCTLFCWLFLTLCPYHSDERILRLLSGQTSTLVPKPLFKMYISLEPSWALRVNLGGWMKFPRRLQAEARQSLSWPKTSVNFKDMAFLGLSGSLQISWADWAEISIIIIPRKVLDLVPHCTYLACPWFPPRSEMTWPPSLVYIRFFLQGDVSARKCISIAAKGQ